VRGLHELGFEILSTGGTAAFLREEEIPVTDVADYTGFPELFEGRVKTLHPKLHGGLLYKRESKDHVRQAEANEIGPIDVVVVNLYPFEQTIARPGSPWRKRSNRSTSAALPYYDPPQRTIAR